jgi:hypothetical protein
MNHDPNTHPLIATASASSRSVAAARQPVRTRCLDDPSLSTGEYNEALALYLRLRHSLVGL